MKQALHPVNVRIAWCRQQRERARSEPEIDGWRAEEDGLRDALLNKDHTLDYQHSRPEVLGRYLLGFEDGVAMLRAARMERAFQHKDRWDSKSSSLTQPAL